MHFFDIPAPRQHHLRECLAARGIACGMKLKVTDVRRIRRGCVTRRRDAGGLHRRIGRASTLGSPPSSASSWAVAPSVSPHGARVAHNALKSDAAPGRKSHRHAGDRGSCAPHAGQNLKSLIPYIPNFVSCF